jgi:uncharacterized membrane protein (DUF106 family)
VFQTSIDSTPRWVNWVLGILGSLFMFLFKRIVGDWMDDVRSLREEVQELQERVKSLENNHKSPPNHFRAPTRR